MIPSDLVTRLRVMMEAAVQPLSVVRELPSDLPPYSPGQRFSANIQSVLPDGTFRAIVAGRTVTLSLPQSAMAGDTLELVVIDRTPRTIIAAQVAASTENQPAPASSATLSRAAQLIGTLLGGTDATLAGAAPLARNAPILPAPPLTGQALAPLLQTAVSESGIFYESHQAQWVTGRMPLSALLREPQGQHSPVTQAGTEVADAVAARAVDLATRRIATSPVANLTVTELESGPNVATTPLHEGVRNAIAPGAATAPTLPDELATLVRQQLDVLANQHVLWLGQIWPGQEMDWEIRDATRERSAEGADDAAAWTTNLRMALPRLGGIAATVKLSAAGAAVDVRAAEAPSAQILQAGAGDLADSLGALGVPLLALKVEHGEPA